MSKEIERHERYKLYAQNSYKYEKTKLSSQKDIFPYGFQQNSKTGFFGYALVEKDRVVIIFRGTDKYSNDTVSTDYKNDFSMVLNKIPEQLTDALNFYDDVKSKFPNKKIDVTGHSLGGSLSQIVPSVRGCEAVTFNAYGTKDMFKNTSEIKDDNIVNYVNEMDGITMVNGENHIGEIYSVPNIAQDSKFSIFYKLNCHYLEGMGNLSERIQKTPNEIKEKATRIHPNALKAKNKISEIGNKQSSNSQCVGSYSVSGYTGSDGTKIRDYTRTCGAKHNN